MDDYFEETIEDLKKIWTKYREVTSKIAEVAEILGKDEITFHVYDGIYYFVVDKYGHLYLSDTTVQGNHVDLEDHEKYTPELLKKSFVIWAEKTYKLGYLSLVGEV